MDAQTLINVIGYPILRNVTQQIGGVSKHSFMIIALQVEITRNVVILIRGPKRICRMCTCGKRFVFLVV